jgi:hypothetical protein
MDIYNWSAWFLLSMTVRESTIYFATFHPLLARIFFYVIFIFHRKGVIQVQGDSLLYRSIKSEYQICRKVLFLYNNIKLYLWRRQIADSPRQRVQSFPHFSLRLISGVYSDRFPTANFFPACRLGHPFSHCRSDGIARCNSEEAPPARHLWES